MPASKRNQKKNSSTRKMKGGKCGNIFFDTGCFLKHKESSLAIKKDSNCNKEKDGTWNVKITTKGWEETDESSERKIGDLTPEEIKKIMCFQKKEPEEVIEVIEKPESVIATPVSAEMIEKKESTEPVEVKTFSEFGNGLEIERDRIRNPYTGRLNTERETITERPPSMMGPFGFRSNPWGGKEKKDKKNRSKKSKK